jgi:general secretion pathway protein B
MSYILEAIRQSEQQRQGAAPSLAAAPMFTHAAKEPEFLRYGIASAALLAAGIMIWWLPPGQHGDPADAAHTISQPPAESMPPQNAPMQTTPLDGASPAPPVPSHPADILHPEVVEELHIMEVKPYTVTVHKNAKPRRTPPPASERITPATPERSQPNNEAASRPSQKEPPLRADETSGTGATQASADGKVLAMHELPPAILHEIPQISISGYSYSTTPEERTVGINDRLIQEGQYIADGLRLEQITPNGLIFSYKNYRFRKSVNSP